MRHVGRMLSRGMLLSSQVVWVWSAAHGWRRRAERRFAAELTRLGVPDEAVHALTASYRDMVPLNPGAYRG